MKREKIMIASLVIILSITSLFEAAHAQHGHRGRVKEKRAVIVHRPHRTVVVRKAHVRYASLPRWGAVVPKTPAAAIVVHHHRHRYYFHSGIFYTRRSSDYIVVRPAPGLRIRVLPAGYRTVVVGPRNYYYYFGTFYVKSTNMDAVEYVVTDAPEGAVVDALPDGYEIKKVGDDEYYELEGVYYAEVDAPEYEDGIGYEVVKL